MLDELVGSRAAILLDDGLNVLGKVPLTELTTTIKSMRNGVYAVVLDGNSDKDLTSAAGIAGVKHVITRDATPQNGGRVNIVISAAL